MAQRSDNVLLAYLRRDPVAAVRTLGVAAAIAAAYFLGARLGLALLFARSDVAVFWPSGVAAGILIVLGHRALPVLLIGVVVGTVAAGVRGPLTSLLNGFWNAGEALLAAWLLEHWFGRSFTFGDLRRVAGILVAAGFATAASVTGAATLTLLHADTSAPFARKPIPRCLPAQRAYGARRCRADGAGCDRAFRPQDTTVARLFVKRTEKQRRAAARKRRGMG